MPSFGSSETPSRVEATLDLGRSYLTRACSNGDQDVIQCVALTENGCKQPSSLLIRKDDFYFQSGIRNIP